MIIKLKLDEIMRPGTKKPLKRKKFNNILKINKRDLTSLKRRIRVIDAKKYKKNDW